jgi:WhiB family redox-sensing transcriptional regulator
MPNTGMRIVFDGRDTSWMARAVCPSVPNAEALFFPEHRGRIANGADPCAEAKAICRRCPVQAACLEYGMGESFGVWGGSSPRDRRRLRRERRLRRLGGAA